MKPAPKSLKRLKQEAKALSKSNKIQISAAQQLVAEGYKFSNWKELLKASDQSNVVKRPTPQASLKFATSEDVSLNKADLAVRERTTELDPDLKLKISKNSEYLTSLGIEHSIFEPTITGLKKSILDATAPVRTHFELEGFHHYYSQGQGEESKVLKEAYFLGEDYSKKTKVSLYRPNTKKGDPRMWFSGLSDFAKPTDQVAILIFEGKLYLINLSDIELQALSDESEIKRFVLAYSTIRNSIAEELLEKLRDIAKRPIKSMIKGDTAVGMAIESALGISANSSKQPDYKGIEIKGGRGGKNRSNLFAQVADWALSKLKSSAEILDKYGYQRGDDFKLYCSVSTLKANSQGLKFTYDETRGCLVEVDRQGDEVAIWPEQQLRARLLEKHSETFWVDAKSIMIDGEEYFELQSILHTQKPLVTQLMPLIQSGVISMDHLIKRKGGGKQTVSEKGPLFKINKRDLKLLFPEPVVYKLK
jgi:hypothetical protein